jgi:CheY-like chemotaxis protein
MGARVVYVEDEPAVQRLVAFWLEDAGYEVLLAGDGRAGLELIRTERPDLVITDALMPEMTGDELVEALVADPELAASPSSWPPRRPARCARAKMLALGCVAVIAKPMEEEPFLATVREALEATET